METVQDLQRRIEGTEDLGSVVRTMKSLAAVSIRQYDEAARSLAQYEAAVRMGLGFVLRDWPFPPVEKATAAKPLALLIGSDQGMCGKLNEEVHEVGRTSIEAMADDPSKRIYIVMGERMAAQFIDTADQPEKIFTLPSSVGGIGGAVSQVLSTVNEIREQRNITAFHVFHAQQGAQQATEPRHAMLWPIRQALLEEMRERQRERRDSKSRSLPYYSMDRGALFSELVGHFLFGSLFRALAASLAAENAARLAAMQGAEKNIDNQLDELRALYRQRRQMNITEELLDIVSGFTALEQQS
ncbi:F0F1 ATP synthase subunit gamma [Oceanidesulfovibrio marinus]|uniref:F-type H+-transporting ATPase subunit gamma n=1 Tax=Oceanidesulfovibrio marinus TaxID=370038 RepID=A0A6P1ZCM6_9BACT|nr:F0F1 ATP synthase subunit gamma [Oceanidesulfovibrio marinus]QJT10782.1 hypothetical protein E8L03_18485 [Oceanidesulfovibrio marinus]TVM31915.1 hypothetical protein DQK91_17070 [Oceanidesulfovibrio marinus]